MSLGRDFRRLWVAFTVSAFGSAVGLGALPLVAVLALDSSTFQVSMLAALSAVAGAALALLMGDFIEQRRKRPVMIASDLVRFAALVSVPVAALGFVLLYAIGGTADLSLDHLATAMVGVHVLIGIGEGVITALAVGSIVAVRPDLVHGARPVLEKRELVVRTSDRAAS